MSDMNLLKAFYTKSYIDPTQEGVSKFLSDINQTAYENSRVFSQLNISSSVQLIKPINITVKDPIYPSPKFTQIVLRNNCEVYHKIEDSIQKEKYSQLQKILDKRQKLNMQIKKMPKILKMAKDSELYQQRMKLKENKKKNPIPRKQSTKIKLPMLHSNSKEFNFNDFTINLNEDTKTESIWYPIQIESFRPEVREGHLNRW